ncbi:acyltransferase [uncultured Desulfovibrio sp.]|uniref:acyltransferase family protein n=1 Tax=uncultured Desulfovibrio sp. TaxID=167968 RepID=UPI002627E50A|nr:acyltransferase [uncultured Desulfovibrio sp.]
MKREVYSIQMLRGIAALLVVIYHTQGFVHKYLDKYALEPSFLTSPGRIMNFGSCGVDIFFVISGFIMAYITYNKHCQTGYPKTFLWKRIVRIVPLYWFYTTIIAGLLFFFPYLFNTATFDLHGLVLSYFFIPYTPVALNQAPVLAVGWTLTYEMYFYLLVSIGLFFQKKIFSVVLGCFFIVSIWIGNYIGSNPVLDVLTNPYLLEFYAGYSIGILFNSNVKIGKKIAFVSLVSSILISFCWIMDVFSAHRFFAYGVPAILLVFGCVFLEKNGCIRHFDMLKKLGDSSYSIYLSHSIALPAVGKVLLLLGKLKIFSASFFVFFIPIICCILGYILYRVLEVPILKFFQKK